MEINYELIIKHLANNTSNNSFDTKKNLMTFSDKFPKEFNEIFGDKFYRLGITQKIDNKNVSFYTSLLTLLCDEYISLTESEEKTYINKLTLEITSYINSNTDIIKKFSAETDNGLLKKSFKDRDVNVWLLETIVNMFSLNILILDFKTLEILTVFPTDIMNPWKPFLVFAKYEDNWEPIKNNDKKFFSYNDNVIKKVLVGNHIEVKYFEKDLIKKDYILVDNVQEIMNNDFKNDIVSSEEIEDVENSEDTEEKKPVKKAKISGTTIKSTLEVKINKNKLTKMTKDEIIEYIKNQNIKATITKKTTKKELIELVIPN